jgi:hypothetical protein
MDRSHWAIRLAQILAVFEDVKRDISRIALRGIETRTHLDSTRTGDLRLEKADQAGGRLPWCRHRPFGAGACGVRRLLPVCRPAGPENPSSHRESLTKPGAISKPELQ